MTTAPQQTALNQALNGPTPEQTERDRINRQQQTPYATQNGMAQAAARPLTAHTLQAGAPTNATASGSSTSFTPTGQSPVTSDGKINEAVQPASPAPPAAPAQPPGLSPAQLQAATQQQAAYDASRVAPTMGASPHQQYQSMDMQPQQRALSQALSAPTAVDQQAPGVQPAAAPAPHPTYSDPSYQAVIEQIREAHPDWAAYSAWKASSGPAGAPGATTPGGSPAPVNPQAPSQLPRTGTGYQQGVGGGPNQELVLPGQEPTLSGGANYTPGNLSQYQGGLNEGLEGTVEDAYRQLMATGGGLPAEQLKARLKDDGLAMRDDLLQQHSGAMASAGRAGGGYAQSGAGDIRAKAVEGVLGGYRDIDIEDSLARRDFAATGVDLGNTLLSGQTGRRQSDYATGLAGELEQENLGFRGAENNRDNYLAQLESWLGNRSADNQRHGIDVSARTATDVANINRDSDRDRSRTTMLTDLLGIMERARGTDVGAGIDWARIMGGLL